MRTIGVLLLPDSRVFDFAVVNEVWAVDRDRVGPFEVRLCAGGPVRLSPAGDAVPTHGLDGLRGCDLVITLGRGDPLADVPDDVRAVLREVHAAGIPVAALCSGAFTLAAAGLLDGRRATTHWALLDTLARVCPAALVDRDVLFTEDDGLLTSAGVVGGLDLCLHLVRRALGTQVATTLARRLVMPPVREGGQAQYVEAPVPHRPERGDIASTVDWAVARLADPIGVADMVATTTMSPRAFHRAFHAAMGDTPGRWLLLRRLRHAQLLLETTDLPVDRIATRSGLGTPANLRRRMRAEFGTTPSTYRRTFAAT
ncbi:helix-turn-helix domain-containing protein [Actinokineospora auranticolor]|uniref:Transcriptional regulator GlxA family with amidase domain n=1 Tax=Actinokineospora auranticolor TaxID=155976 RepID=A0A2S6GGB2_9PSEU|nr:helix-turn-helix domain-containing protein [Actinokineospora auranticolor]PPK64249.1 transcriptional regulator GlxA family with amidase domain [Actinokineospora auranticolor]